MHNIIIEKKYQFIPPHHGSFWPCLMRSLSPLILRKKYGILQVRCSHAQRLQASLAAGHSVIVAPNHCRPIDPYVLTALARELNILLYIMASWHIFKQDKVSSWFLKRSGAFSVYREGIDKVAIKAAIDLLVKGNRPLVIFPEGVISRSNDMLKPLMGGIEFIARAAAKKRAKISPNKKVVIHPIAIKYYFNGDLQTTLSPVLQNIEHRLTWAAQEHLALDERIVKIGSALLHLKEIEYLGKPQPGEIKERLQYLINAILAPQEQEWISTPIDKQESVVSRVKKLRALILPDMIKGEISDKERERRWKQLADGYLAQQMSHYSPGYIFSSNAPERKLETVERFEEDLTDISTIHRPMSVALEVGEALEVAPTKKRDNEAASLMNQLEAQLTAMLQKLALQRNNLSG